MSSTETPELSFTDLDLPAFLQETIAKVGYETPSPIQQATIPLLLAGKDIVGMAQTGTGKTAAFALPILSKIDVKNKKTQALVLCPTRELAIQVAEAFQTYAQGLKGFQVLPIYGGQDMGRQLQALKRGVHVVVATPGRLLDHLRRGTMDIGQINTLVLDEGDEMLRMGFIDDVEEILKKTPPQRQVALFSATMPKQIRTVAEKYLNDPQEVRIKTAASTNEDIEQYYWLVQGTNKLDALTRMLEVEEFDGMIIFVRTRNSTTELADKLNARGFSASALNGDMNQSLRQRTVQQLKSGALDILVATDVAARGLDVDRISHVMNYDIPYDNEAYVHRIGRTGRAGRSGKAILFVSPRERRMLQSIERTTRKKITQMELPTRGQLVELRSEQFRRRIADAVEQGNLDFFHNLVEQLCREQECSIEDAAAAMAMLLQKDKPLGAADKPDHKKAASVKNNDKEFIVAAKKPRPKKKPIPEPMEAPESSASMPDPDDVPMEAYRLEVGKNDGVTPREIVGAIANEAELEGRFIGRVRVHDDHSTVDLPTGMPREILRVLRKARVCNKPLALSPLSDNVAAPGGPGDGRDAPKVRKARAGKPAAAGEKAKPARAKPGKSSPFGERAKPVKKRKRDADKNKDKGKRRTPTGGPKA